MKLSKKFLSDYIDLTNIDFNDLANKMVSVGNEYDSIVHVSNATGLKVGYVKECADIKESNHLHVTMVDLGDETKQIVCGAPNVRAGIKVIVATIGAKLPGGEIKPCRLAGYESNGMICSLSEIGLPEAMIREEDKKGIHILSDDAVVGSDALIALGLDDVVIDFELTANRADLLSIIGMAYEVGAIYNREVVLPKIELQDENLEEIDVKYDIQTDKCFKYLGLIVKDVEIKESPEFIKSRLISSGIRPINNVVDISNYVMLEYGQPLHFFDADKLGHKIIVRNANPGEEIVTLDSQTRELIPSDIVIANDKEPVALAGVMGGLTTEVENTTKNIFIEAAIFDPVSIRYTSKRILRSEASNRYEKGIDPAVTEKAIKRAAYLLSKYAGGKNISKIKKFDKTTTSDKVIDITMQKINQVLGMNLTVSDVCQTLNRLKFTYKIDNENLTVYVPTRRLDVNIKEELIEEIGRIYGFTNIKGKLPTLPIKKGMRSKKNQYNKNIRTRLAGLGLNQVMTYSLISEEKSNMFVGEEYGKIRVLYPMTEERKVMRKQLVTSLIDVYEYNSARNIKDINIFEIGSNYYTKGDKYIEENLVAGLISDNLTNNIWSKETIKANFYVLKGIVENLLEYLGFANRYSYDTKNLLKDLHPTRSANIYVDKELVGYMGQVHPSISKKEIYVFELNLDKLMAKKLRNIKCKEISKYPEVHKDLAFVVKKSVTNEQVVNAIKKAGGRLLIDIKLFDVYTGENVKSSEKSLAYSLTFQSMDETLTDDVIMSLINKIVNEVRVKVDGTLRDN